MNTLKQLAKVIAALAFLLVSPTAGAATAAGAGIELDGKYVGGYTITQNGESRQDLYGLLASRHLTFERDFKIPVDHKTPTVAILKGNIRILTKIRGDRQVTATTTELRLEQREGKWYVEEESLPRALKAAAPAQVDNPKAGDAAPALKVWNDGMTKQTTYVLSEKGQERLMKLLNRKPDQISKAPILLMPTGTIEIDGQTYAVEPDKIVLATKENAKFWNEKGIRDELIKLGEPQAQPSKNADRKPGNQ
jgi:hypothetical protein